MTQPKQRQDGAWTCFYNGKLHYLGKGITWDAERYQEMLGSEKPSEKPKHSLSVVVERYLKSIEGVYSNDTLYNKRGYYARFLKAVGDISITAVTTDMLVDLRARQLKVNKKTSVNTNFANLGALFAYAKDNGYITESPVLKMPKLKVNPERDIDTLSEEEFDRLLAICTNDRDRLMFVLLVNTGLRRKEMIDLGWDDVDLDNKVLHVRHGKGDKSRIVGINKRLSDLLKRQQQGEHVVCSLQGKQLTRDGVNSIVKKYVAALNHTYKGRKRLSIHSLRASFATRLARKNVSPIVIKELLGHSDLRTTMKYVSVTHDDLKNAVEMLD